MVHVKCFLTRAVRRCDPTTVTTDQVSLYIAQMHTLIRRICNKTRFGIDGYYDESLGVFKAYEDLHLIVRFQISSVTDNADKAENRLLDAFRSELIMLPSENYWLTIVPQASNTEEHIATYYQGLTLMTFVLGFMSSPAEFYAQFDYHRDLYSISQEFPEATLEIDSGKITIDFSVSEGEDFYKCWEGAIASTTEVYRIEIDFKDLAKYVLVQKNCGAVDLCFLTTAPMQLWRTQYNFVSLGRISFDKTRWIRTCGIKSASYCGTHLTNSLGQSNALTLRIPNGIHTKNLIDSLRDYGGFRIYYTNINYLPRMDLTAAAPCSPIPGTDGDLINWLLAAIHSIGFRVKYQLQDVEIRENFMEQVRRYSMGSRDDRRHLENALSRSFDVLLNDSERFLHIDRVLRYFLGGVRELSEPILMGTRFVKRLIITPSRILLAPPYFMHDNRILREFDANSAVCCSFQNDDMTGFAGVANTIGFVDEAIGKVLREGVRVANRHYVFLGCSGSQLKQNGCWMYSADNKGNTAENIRKWMGDLDHIRNVGTYLARMGQCFSDTTAAELDIGFDINWEDDDIEGGSDPDGKPYCFSDGVGRISLDCLNEVFMRLHDEHRPSAFQVRLGGSKGMLTLDPNLTGKTIMVRKSMLKFKSPHSTIEVMRRTQPTPLFLNCQIITILSQLENGIGDRVFIRMLNNMLHRFADVLLDDSKAKVALSQSGFSCCYSKLYKAGLSFTTDPFFKGVLKAITCARISGLKNKTRIEIPTEYGRGMLGVMDEVGVLNYGEVFIRYSANVSKPMKDLVVHQGDVVVSKMPCLHPGDVRKFKAVDHEELRHLVDCIVFPRKGPRPHPNEMAGSDLDGDEYFVTWMPDLIFCGPNHPPMDFPSRRKTAMERSITVDDMVEFMVNHSVNDKVGQISNAHLAWADIEGIHSYRCKELARIFCHVIDFNKTGYLPNEVIGKNITSLLPDEYPDFMCKDDHMKTYRSRRIMGQLFRISKRVEIAVTTIDKDDNEKINKGTNWKIDNRFSIDGYEAFIPIAEALYSSYAALLDAAQQCYGIESEEELVSANVIKIKGAIRRASDILDIEKRLYTYMRDVKKYIVGIFDQQVEQTDGLGGANSKGKRKQLLAAACYNVTYRETKKHRSFPWLFAEYLVEVLQKSNKLRDSPDPPLITLTRSIDEINMDDVQRLFCDTNEQVPQKDILARVYYVLINWGIKSKYLAGEKNYCPNFLLKNYGPTLSVRQYIWLLDRIVAEDGDVAKCLVDGNSGTMLLAMFRAITNLDDNLVMDGVELPRAAVIDMKNAVIIGHHQVARDPRAQCLLIRLQSNIHRIIAVDRKKWNDIKSSIGYLTKHYKTNFNVKTDFRRKPGGRGGQITIYGEEQDVINFTEDWQKTD